MPFGCCRQLGRHDRPLAAQATLVDPGHGHGYHGVTFGHLVASGQAGHRLVSAVPRCRILVRAARPRHPDAVARALRHERADMVLAAAPRRSPLEDVLRPLAGRRPRAEVLPRSARLRATCRIRTTDVRAAEIPAANGTDGARARPVLRRAGLWRHARRRADALRRPRRRSRQGSGSVARRIASWPYPTAFGLGFERTIPEWTFGPVPNTYGHNGSGRVRWAWSTRHGRVPRLRHESDGVGRTAGTIHAGPPILDALYS